MKKSIIIVAVIFGLLIGSSSSVSAEVHDVAVTIDEWISPVVQGDWTGINYTVTNEGTVGEWVNLTVNDTTENIVTCSERLFVDVNGSLLNFCYWLTTNHILGDHTILVTSQPLAGENDTADNTDSTIITLVSQDNPPVADAGPDQNADLNETVYFNGSASTDDNGIVLYEWDFETDGTYDATGVNVANSYDLAGNYTVTLRVTDTGNQTDTDTALVTVSEPDNPPVAEAGPYQSVLVNETTYFDGSNSTDDNGIILYEWDFEWDGTFDATGALVSHTYQSEGSYIVFLRVTDTANQTDADTTLVNVSAPDLPPVADVGPDQSVLIGETVNFDGSGSSDDNGITLYEWDFESDGTYDATGVTASNVYSVAGNYTVTLRVTDTGGQTDTDTAVVVVSESDLPPVADAGPDQLAKVGETVFFNGGNSTDDNGITLYEWDFESDGTYDATGVFTSNVYNIAMNYTVTLRVTDTANQTDTDTTLVYVEPDYPPFANAGPDQTVYEDDTVTLDGSASNDDIGISLYEWDFESDGTYDATGAVVNTVYDEPGVYTATLKVTDTAGQTDTDTAIITVDPALLDITSLVTDKATYNAGETVTATATVMNNFGTSTTDVFVDFVYKDPAGLTINTETKKIKRLNPGQSKDAISTYTIDSGSQSGTYTVEASVRWSGQVYNTESTNFEVLSGGGPGNVTIHVESIDFSTIQQGPTEKLLITVTILDDQLNPVSGATVDGVLTLPDSTNEPYSGETGADGSVTFTYFVRKQALPSGTYTFTVTDVVKSGTVYDPAQNVETSDSFVK